MVKRLVALAGLLLTLAVATDTRSDVATSFCKDGRRVGLRRKECAPVSVPVSVLSGFFSGFWKLGEATLADRLDSIDSLTLNGTSVSVTQIAGKIGNAAAYDGSGRLQLRAATYITTGPSFTQVVWFKTSSVASQYLLSWENGASDLLPKLNIGLQGAGKVAFWTDAAHKGATTTSTYNNNAWHLAVGWHDATTKYNHLIIDNNEHVIDNSGAAGDVGAVSAGFIELGAQGGGSILTGALDATGMADNRIPSAAQLNLLWNGGAGIEPPF